MEIADLINLVAGNGLAVVMCIAFFWQSTKQNTRIIELTTSLSEKITNNNADTEKLLSAMQTLINCVDRLATRIEGWEDKIQ